VYLLEVALERHVEFDQIVFLQQADGGYRARARARVGVRG